MYNNYYTQTQQPPQTYRTVNASLKGRPVASFDEARAMPIDFDGSIFFFPDLANKRIYTKQINMDGTMSLNMYEMKEIPIVENNNVGYVSREEFDNIIQELKKEIAAGRIPQHTTSSVPEQPTGRTFQTNF